MDRYVTDTQALVKFMTGRKVIDDVSHQLHDRLIASTARYLNLPIITNDPIILKSKWVKTLYA